MFEEVLTRVQMRKSSHMLLFWRAVESTLVNSVLGILITCVIRYFPWGANLTGPHNGAWWPWRCQPPSLYVSSPYPHLSHTIHTLLAVAGCVYFQVSFEVWTGSAMVTTLLQIWSSIVCGVTLSETRIARCTQPCEGECNAGEGTPDANKRGKKDKSGRSQKWDSGSGSV